MSDVVQLPYRALTGNDPERVWERVREADREGFKLLGAMEQLHDAVAHTTIFMQVVYDPKRVKINSGPYIIEQSEIVTGDTSRAFCERVSRLIVEEGRSILRPPRLFFQNGKPAISQKLRW